MLALLTDEDTDYTVTRETLLEALQVASVDELLEVLPQVVAVNYTEVTHE